MGVSIIQTQHDIIINTIKKITQGDWKVLVIDAESKRVLDNSVREDDILNQNIANIERIEEKRDMNPTMDAIYMVSAQPHILDCLLADFDRRRYRRSFLVWTSILSGSLRRRLDSHPLARQVIGGFETIFIDFFPRESHLVTFRDPWSFPVLYHPGCNNLIREHMQGLAQKITGICVALGEYPKIRYYRPQVMYDASVLCSHLARFVQEELDNYAKYNRDFPPPSQRPQGVLVITDRTMDLLAPMVHEFTYQAMAHDLLTINDREKVTYHMTVNDKTPEAEEKDVELQEKDKVWIDNRHRHMKDTIDKLMGDFQKFLSQNPQFTDRNGDATNLNTIKDMLAGLPQFQEMKEAYSLHLTMAQECMNTFQAHKLPDIASVEQTLATGLDEDFRKPKNILEQVVRLLDDEAIIETDRLRLLTAYILYRDGLTFEDTKRLMTHASLPPQRAEFITNLELLGARPSRTFKETRQPPQPLFPIDPKLQVRSEEYALSRYEPNLKPMLEHICKGTLDPVSFPHTKPPLDPNEDSAAALQGSLRAAKPSWAGAGRRVAENRQVVIVFMAGGATYSEARTCYEISEKHGRDVFLATSHMITPSLFLRQVGDLGQEVRKLDLPAMRPKPRAPAHLFEQERPVPPPAAPPSIGRQGMQGGLPSRPGPASGLPPPPPQPPQPPTQSMGQMSLGAAGREGGGGAGSIGGRDSNGDGSRVSSSSTAPADIGGAGGKPGKEKEKKKRNMFGLKK